MRQIYIVRHPFLILAKRHRHTKSTKPAPPLSSSSSSSSFDCDSNSSINNNNARPSLAPLRKTNQWTERREKNNEFIQISTKNDTLIIDLDKNNDVLKSELNKIDAFLSVASILTSLMNN